MGPVEWTPWPSPVPQQLTLNNRSLPTRSISPILGSKVLLSADHHLKRGLTVAEGWITHDAVAEDLSMKYKEPDDLI